MKTFRKILIISAALPLPWITSAVMAKPLELYVTTWYSPLATESPGFEMAMTLQLFTALYPPLIFFCLEACFFIITLHCCGQLKVLASTIQNSDRRIIHANPEWRCQCSCVKCIVETHWKIIR